MPTALRRGRHLPSLILLLSVLLGSGCGSDFQLHHAPDGEGGEGGEDTPPRSPPTPTDPPPSFPWGELDPGNLPEIYFAVAWSPWQCTQDMDGAEESDAKFPEGEPPPEEEPPPEPSDFEGSGCPVYFAVVDLHGHVVTEVPLPEEQVDWSPYSLLSLSPAGPGEFLAVVENQGPLLDGDQADSFWSSAPWEAWRGNGVTGEATQVARLDQASQEVVLPITGRQFELEESFGMTQLAMWPGAPDWLLTWSTSQDCSDGLSDLRAVHVSSGMYLDRTWSAEDLLPDSLLEEAEESGLQWMPWNFDAALGPDDDNQLLLGLTGACSPGDTVQKLVSWSVDEGPLWTADLPIDTPHTASFSPLGEGAAFQLAYGETSWLTDNWRVTGPNGTVEGNLADNQSLTNHRGGPLLDPTAPSFLVISSEVAPSGLPRDVVELYHEGAPVWRIDQLRFGLQWEDVFIVDLVVLPGLDD